MIVASRYAKSLLDLSIENKQLEVVRKDMQIIDSLCKSNREFVLLLESPVVNTDKKIAILKSIFEKNISTLSLSFLNLIASKRRENYISHIASSFDAQYKIYKNITTVKIESAIALDAKLKESVLSLVKQNVKGEIELMEKVNPSLIGGFILTINDKQIDQSIASKLNKLKKDFSGNLFVPSMN
ncbi:MAG: ATP synthase F1 subunit delta [Sphingobacteriaceae bacterium]|nr:ATP synthase F1 subunit delta [Sphingobacteriaceae bacterium]